MKTETLRVVWKIIRRKGDGRTPATYCRYNVENKNHQHKLRVSEGTKLFDLLSKTIISKSEDYYEKHLYVDCVYYNNILIKVINPRVI